MALVGCPIDDGWKFVAELAHEGLDAIAAFWVRPAESSQWYLHIVAPSVDADATTAGYRLAHSVWHRLPGLSVGLFDIKLRGTADPMVREVLELMHQYPDQLPMRVGARRLGGTFVEDAYIYPPLVPVAP